MSQPENRTRDHAQGEDQNPSSYPTYRDGPVPPHMPTTTKPTDVGLPRERRTFGWPMLSAVTLALIVGVLLLIWGGAQLGTSEAPPLDPARSGSVEDVTPTESDEMDTPSGPEVSPEPGAIDVPG